MAGFIYYTLDSRFRPVRRDATSIMDCDEVPDVDRTIMSFRSAVWLDVRTQFVMMAAPTERPQFVISTMLTRHPLDLRPQWETVRMAEEMVERVHVLRPGSFATFGRAKIGHWDFVDSLRVFGFEIEPTELF